MKLLMRILFGRSVAVSRSDELDEYERVVDEQKLRLARIRHLQRERNLYRRRQRPT